VAIDNGTVRVVTGEASNATVTFIQNWDTATAISRGELSAQGAFMTGRIRVRGDLPKLVEYGNVFGGVDDVFADLRMQTTY
jgi:putative sterol carrier protein